MKRKLLFATFCFLFGSASIGFSQNATMSKASSLSGDVKAKEQLSLKPADEKPVTFSSQEELESAVPVKSKKIKEMIESGQYSGDRLRILREELWRFENAVVVKQ